MAKDLPEEIEFNLSENVRLITVDGFEAIVGLNWNEIPSKKYLKSRKFLTQQPSRNTLVHQSGEAIQIAFVDDEYNKGKPLTSIIIDEIVNNFDLTGHWVYFTRVDEDSIWYFIADENGYIEPHSDRITPLSEFLDEIDEYILVSDIPDNILKIYSSDLKIFDDFEDLVEKVEFSITREMYDKSEFKINKRKTILFKFFFILLFAVMGSLYFYLDNNLTYLDVKVDKRLPSVPKVKQDKSWETLSKILDQSMSPEFISHYFNDMLFDIPLNTAGWDLRNIDLNNKQVIITYTSSPYSKVSITDLKTRTKQFLINNVKDLAEDDIGFNTNPNRTQLEIYFNASHHEKILTFDSVSDMVDASGYQSQVLDAKSAKKVLQKYNTNSMLKMNLASKYTSKSVISLTFDKIFGDFAADQSRVYEINRDQDIMFKEYTRLIDAIKKPISPPDEVWTHRQLDTNNITNIFDFQKKTDILVFKESSQKFKNNQRQSEFDMKGVGISELVSRIKTMKSIPARYHSVTYDWMTSLWVVKGVIYERN